MDKRVAYFQEMLGAFLKGKVAILNGAGNSIGVAIAKALVEAGATVYIACNKVDGDIQALSAIYEDRIKLSLCNCVEKNDMSKFVERVMRECSKIDILVNNPSFNAPAKLEELEDHVFYKMMDECLIGAYHACQNVVPHMKERQYGKIVNVSHFVAKLGGASRGLHFNIARGGLLSMTKELTGELFPFNINVNAVAPGIIQGTDVAGQDVDMLHVPLGRVGTPDEAAAPVAFLCSDYASFISGACIDVNGGAYMD